MKEERMAERSELIISATKNDAKFAGTVISSMSIAELANVSPIAAFCMSSYFSLFVYEGYARLSGVEPQLVSPLSSLAASVGERSRHSLKFFEDTRRGIEGQISYFENEILAAHSEEFTGNTPVPFAQRWETDLGLFRYNGRLISTTHSATYALGLDPRTMFDEGMGQELSGIMSEFGSYFARLGATLDVSADSFLKHISTSKIGMDEDVQSGPYYEKIFNGANTPGINCLMTVFQSNMNFVDAVLTAGGTNDSTEYSPFKIRFLTIYQILRSLDLLRAERASQLTSDSLAAIADILNTAEAQTIIDPTAKPFRNTLMHYGPDSRIDISLIDKDDLVGSMVPLCYQGLTAEQFGSVVEKCISHTAARLNEWHGYL